MERHSIGEYYQAVQRKYKYCDVLIDVRVNNPEREMQSVWLQNGYKSEVSRGMCSGSICK